MWNNNKYQNRYSPFTSTQRGQKQIVKHSGAKVGTDKNGNPFLRAWKYDKTNGLRTFLITPYSKTKNVTSQSGKEWENWLVKVTEKNGRSFLTSALVNVRNNKAIIKDMSFVVNPSASNGGYCGPFYKK